MLGQVGVQKINIRIWQFINFYYMKEKSIWRIMRLFMKKLNWLYSENHFCQNHYGEFCKPELQFLGQVSELSVVKLDFMILG